MNDIYISISQWFSDGKHCLAAFLTKMFFWKALALTKVLLTADWHYKRFLKGGLTLQWLRQKVWLRQIIRTWKNAPDGKRLLKRCQRFIRTKQKTKEPTGNIRPPKQHPLKKKVVLLVWRRKAKFAYSMFRYVNTHQRSDKVNTKEN